MATAPVSGQADVDRAYAAASTAFETWGDTTPGERQAALLKFADAIEARAEDFIRLEGENTGKPHALTRSEEIPPMLDQLRFFAGAARVLEGKSAGEYMKGHTSFVRREPIGVVGQVTPWNYPMMMAMWKIAPALAAGNTIVLKPSDTTPETTLLLAELASEFLPEGTFNVITGDRETGRMLVEHPTPASSPSPARSAPACRSPRARRTTSSACTSSSAARPRSSSSTTPTSRRPSRASRAPATSTPARTARPPRACSRVRGSMTTSSPRWPSTPAARSRSVCRDDEDASLGPVNNANQMAHVSGFLDRLPDHARVAAGGSRVNTLGDGFFFEPTVLAGLRQDDEHIQNEIFGPVITVQQFTDEAEALAWANGVQYGLASCVWTRDFGKAMRMSKKLDFGCVWINTHIPIVAEMPHGGFKHSGYGKDLSMYGLEDYTRIKHVMANIES